VQEHSLLPKQVCLTSSLLVVAHLDSQVGMATADQVLLAVVLAEC
jgi:hypothetical protein